MTGLHAVGSFGKTAYKGSARREGNLPQTPAGEFYRLSYEALKKIDEEVAEENLPTIDEDTKDQFRRLRYEHSGYEHCLVQHSGELPRSTPDWLVEALAALKKIDEEVAEENLPTIDEDTKDQFRRLRYEHSGYEHCLVQHSGELPRSTPDWLVEALAALKKIDEEVAEESLPTIDEDTKDGAARIIKALAAKQPIPPTVYPTQDGEIAIHFRAADPDPPGSVVVLLSNGGQAECYAHTKGKNESGHYDDFSVLPDGFILAQLSRLRSSESSTPVAVSAEVDRDRELWSNMATIMIGPQVTRPTAWM